MNDTTLVNLTVQGIFKPRASILNTRMFLLCDLDESCDNCPYQFIPEECKTSRSMPVSKFMTLFSDYPELLI